MFSERQQANDLFQGMLIRLWKGFGSFEGRSSEKTFFIWLLLRLFDLLFWYILLLAIGILVRRIAKR